MVSLVQLRRCKNHDYIDKIQGPTMLLEDQIDAF